MKKLFVLIAAIVLVSLSACKKETLQIINNNYTTIIDSTNNGDTTPVTPTLFYDSTAISGSASDANVSISGMVGTIRELASSELPFLAYGNNTIGCEMAITFKFYKGTGVTFEPDQRLQINFPNLDYVAKASNVQTVGSGTGYVILRASIIIMRNVNATPLALSVTLENFYYSVNNRPYSLSVNATSNGVMFLTKGQMPNVTL